MWSDGKPISRASKLPPFAGGPVIHRLAGKVPSLGVHRVTPWKLVFPTEPKTGSCILLPLALEPHLAHKQSFPFVRRGGLCITNTLVLLHKSLLGGSHFSPWREWCTNRDGRGPARESLFEDIWSRQYSFSALFIVEQSSPPHQGFLLESL